MFPTNVSKSAFTYFLNHSTARGAHDLIKTIMEKRPLDNKIKYGGSNSDSLDSELNFIPFKECPFEYAASVTLPPLVNGPETPSSDWQAIIGAIIPTVIAACLISTCYFCYRYGTVHRKTNSKLFVDNKIMQ